MWWLVESPVVLQIGMLNYSSRILKMDQIRWVRPAFVSDRRRWSLKPSSPSSSLPRSLLTFRIQLVFSPPRLCRLRFKHSMRGHSSDFLYPLRCFLGFFLGGAIVIRGQPRPRKLRNSARPTCNASMSPESVVFWAILCYIQNGDNCRKIQPNLATR